jgi:hypothetical protein
MTIFPSKTQSYYEKHAIILNTKINILKCKGFNMYLKFFGHPIGTTLKNLSSNFLFFLKKYEEFWFFW